MTPLVADSFFNDPKVIDAQNALIEALKSHQGAIKGIKPPQAERANDYKQTLDSFQEVRGNALFYPYVSSGIGNGPFVELLDGSIKYDFISGIGVHHFGHSHPEIIRTSIHAALEDTVMQGNLQQGKTALNFSKKLIQAASINGAQLEHCFLSTTGVMAGENALKIAFQKNYPANRVLAFSKCFAGRTIAFSQITDKPAYREGVPETMSVDYVPFYREDDPKGSTQESINALNKHLNDHPGKHAAMIFELIQGEGGYYPGSNHFHRQLMEICREHNILVLVDEVQTFARTTQPFAFQHFKLDDLVDIVWLGKASQVCATLFKAACNPKPGLLSQTFTSSTTAIAAGEHIIDHLLAGNYFGENGKISKLHQHFVQVLDNLHKKHPKFICGPYGAGSMIAFTAFEGDSKKSHAFIKKLFENGVLSFIAGADPTRIRFLMPIMVTEKKHILEVSKIIEKTLLEIASA